MEKPYYPNLYSHVFNLTISEINILYLMMYYTDERENSRHETDIHYSQCETCIDYLSIMLHMDIETVKDSVSDLKDKGYLIDSESKKEFFKLNYSKIEEVMSEYPTPEKCEASDFQNGYLKVPNSLISEEGLSNNEKMLIQLLIRFESIFHNSGKEVYVVRDENLCEKLNIDREEYDRCIENLIKSGFIDTKGFKNYYQVNYKKLGLKSMKEVPLPPKKVEKKKKPNVSKPVEKDISVEKQMKLALEIRERVERENNRNICYVYLMQDTSLENTYKIGISKTPEFREKTLQADKPTIEMIFSKKYSDRSTALLLEKTLHQLYDCKRMRGEWFNLNDEDVDHIQSLLKS